MNNIIAMDKIITDLSYYDHLPSHTYIYVKDLKVQGWEILSKIGINGDDHKVCNYNGRRPKGKWVSYFAIGGTTPELKYIKWYNEVCLYDYSRFDSSRGVGLNEITMQHNIEILINEFGFIPTTPTKAIKQLLIDMDANGSLNPSIWYEWNSYFSCPTEWFPVIEKALIGGSSFIQPYWDKRQHTVSRETHIDYHQIYGSVLKNSELVFPCSQTNFETMQEIEGYHECAHDEVAIYVFGKDSYATVKPLGYALFGPQVDLSVQSLCNVDLETLAENYNIHATIDYTLLWTKVYHGGDNFLGPLVDRIYKARKRYKGTPAEGVFKVYNEILPGFFSRTMYTQGSVWKKDFKTGQSSKCTWYNPSIGIFINAYARAMLNNLLQRLPYDKVIGWDTDAAFFKGVPSEIPTCVKVMFGDEPGQLHIDGNYYNVVHQAPKSYWGMDNTTNEPFIKRAGVPKSGNIAMWNPNTHKFDINRYSLHTNVRK